MTGRLFRMFHLALLCVLLAACGQTLDDAPEQADQALEELKKFYEEARKNAPEDPVEWAKEDFQRFGDWEYRVVSIPLTTDEAIEAQLNDYGEDRWEVFWLQESAGEMRIMLKRPARSYLRSVPFSEIGKAFSGDGAAQ